MPTGGAGMPTGGAGSSAPPIMRNDANKA
jgi:hypothetical protein